MMVVNYSLCICLFSGKLLVCEKAKFQFRVLRLILQKTDVFNSPSNNFLANSSLRANSKVTNTFLLSMLSYDKRCHVRHEWC